MTTDFASIATDDWRSLFAHRPIDSMLIDDQSYVVFLDSEDRRYILIDGVPHYGPFTGPRSRQPIAPARKSDPMQFHSIDPLTK